MALPGPLPVCDLRLSTEAVHWDLRGLWVLDANVGIGTRSVTFDGDLFRADEVLAAMDRCGVALAVCSHHLSIGPDTSLGNRLVAEAIEKHPDRFRGWITINPHRPEEMKAQLTRYGDHLGFVGVKLHPDLHEARVDTEGYVPAWEWCEERHKPLLSHTCQGSTWSDPEIFVPLAGLYPHVAIILGHSGGTYGGHARAIQLAQRYPSFYLDTTNSVRYLGRIRRMVEGVGAHRVLFGSDMPFLSLPSGLGAVLWADITDEERRLVLGDNARRLLGI